MSYITLWVFKEGTVLGISLETEGFAVSSFVGGEFVCQLNLAWLLHTPSFSISIFKIHTAMKKGMPGSP
jgi:hypothetical protein